MVIGLTGKMGAGKDTVADYLVENYGFTKVGFADALYTAVSTLFDITREQAERFKEEGYECYWAKPSEWPKITATHPVTMRQLLQRFGTDVGRDQFSLNLWTVLLEKRLAADPETDYVIKDVRFDNEAKMLTFLDSEDGTIIPHAIWQIVRPGYEGDSHKSEAGIDESYLDISLINNDTLNVLYADIDEIMKVEYGRQRVNA